MPLVSERFQTFSNEHFVLIGIFLTVFIGLIAFGRTDGDNERFRQVFAIAIPVFTLPMQIGQLLPSDFGIGTSLPLQYCDLAWGLAAYALWTRKPWAVALTFFWGLTLTTQGIITPSLGQQFPEWPAYVVIEIVVVAAVWALMTWPFDRHPPTTG